MNLRPALLAAAALAAIWIGLTLGRWGAGGNRDLAAVTREFQRGEELESRFEASRRRFEAMWALASKVIVGGMTLPEAAEHVRRLDEVHPGYPPGIPRPAGDEAARCDWVLHFVWETFTLQERFAAAARWYAAAFTAHPHLLAGPSAKHRYHAACAAAMAGCGQGRDAADLDEKTRAGFRRQARDWLRAELEARRRLLERASAQDRGFIAGGLQRWLRDPYFDRVRGPEALGRLPAAERQAWHQLWADVADTLARAEGTTPPEQRAGSKIPLPEP
jgi:hypothetical protein